MKKTIITLVLLFLTITPAISAQTITITGNNPYLMLFDKKISKATVGDASSVKLELLNTISNDKQELLIKPIKPTYTTLVVSNGTTKTNYKLEILKPNQIDEILGDLELDNPNGTKQDLNNYAMILDKPPSAGNTRK